MQALLGDDPSLAPLKQLLIVRTEGNPFFLEESVRTLVETGVLLGERGAYRLAQALPTVQVPATVQAVLAARIDRLPPEEKQLLQSAAVIGTEVPLALLQSIAEVPEEPLRLGLTHLQAAEFLYETRLFPEIEYTFKHALTQQVAYETLLQERRRALHARIVEALEGLAGERVAEQVERLAHHALRGEVWDKALAYCRQAGEKAMARSAYREAVGYFEQALSALAHLPEQRDTREQAIDLRLRPAHGTLSAGDLGRILACLRRPRPSRRRSTTRVDWGRSLSVWQLFPPQWARMTRLSPPPSAPSRSPRRAGMSSCRRWRTSTWACLPGPGRLSSGDRLLRADHGVPRRERGATSASVRFSYPPCSSRAWLAWCYAELGMFAEGRALGDEALRIAEAVDHPPSLMVASWGLGLLALRQGDLPRALPRLERAVGLCQDADLPLYFPWMAAALGAAYTLSGRVADAVPLLSQALEQTIATEMVVIQTLCSLSLGEAHLLAGRPEEAHALAERRAGARPCASGTGARSVCPAAPRRHCGASRSPRRRSGRNPLPAGPRPGRRAGHAPARGPLPPRPRHAVSKIGRREQARAELSTAIDALPRHGDDLLAATGRGGAGTGGMNHGGKSFVEGHNVMGEWGARPTAWEASGSPTSVPDFWELLNT